LTASVSISVLSSANSSHSTLDSGGARSAIAASWPYAVDSDGRIMILAVANNIMNTILLASLLSFI
jgi:hypothetical protein